MPTNLQPSLLDAPQIVKRVFNGTNDSIRVNIGDANDLSVTLSAVTGDSVNTYAGGLAAKASVTNASVGLIVAATACVGMKSFIFYTNTTSTITGAQACTLEISPSDTDDVWVASTLTITPSTVNGTIVAGVLDSSFIARRCRVRIAAAITTGTFDIYLVAQSV